MSGIISIVRDWGDAPAIVRIQTSDSLATVSGANYILNQAVQIAAANNGAFDWQASDSVLVYASDGSAFYTISADFKSLNLLGSQQITVPLSNAQILGMYAAPVLLVPAPPAGVLSVVTDAYLNIDYGAAQFANGGVIGIQYEGTVHGAGTLAMQTIAAATLNAVTADIVLLFLEPTSILTAAAAGQALYLSNATGAFITGDSVGELVLVYRNIVLV